MVVMQLANTCLVVLISCAGPARSLIPSFHTDWHSAKSLPFIRVAARDACAAGCHLSQAQHRRRRNAYASTGLPHLRAVSCDARGSACGPGTAAGAVARLWTDRTRSGGTIQAALVASGSTCGEQPPGCPHPAPPMWALTPFRE